MLVVNGASGARKQTNAPSLIIKICACTFICYKKPESDHPHLKALEFGCSAGGLLYLMLLKFKSDIPVPTNDVSFRGLYQYESHYNHLHCSSS